MAYQETNNTLTDLDTTPEQAVEQRDQAVEHNRLKRTGVLKKAAQKILAKPVAKKEG